MHSTLSQSLAGLALISSAFASPLVTGHGHNGSHVPHPTGTYRMPNGTYTNGTANSTGTYPPTVTVMQTVSPPPAYAVTPVPIESYVPGPKLQPAVHWDHPVDDINQLAPTNASSLYYASNGTADAAVEHMFASMNTTSQYQSVVLAHSSYVQSVSCAADGVLVTFTNADGFNYAANAWPQQGTDFVLVTYTDGCGNSSDQRTFWLIDSLTYLNSTNSIDAKVTREIGVEDAFNDVHMVWGKYTPADNATTVSKRGFNSGDKTVSKTADINLSAPTGDSSPWGGAALLFEEPGKVSVSNTSGSAIDTDFKIFCVNCGVQSHFTLQGEAAWQYLPPKITKLTAEVDANIVANFHLGLVATAEFDDTKTKNLFNEPIPDLGFSVGGVFEAGIYVTVDAVANIDITAEGQALAGVTMTVPDFKASLDMLSEDSGSNSKMSGFTPTWEKQFEVAGALGAKASLALPVGLHLGIKIVKIFDKSIALVEQPSLSAQAQIAGSVGGQAVDGVTCNNGVSYSIDAHNDITLNLFDVKTFNLEHADWNILSGCKQLPQSSTSTSEVSTVTSTTEDASTSTSAAADNSTMTTTDSQATGTGIPINSANATVPLGTGKYSKTLLPTGGSTGIPPVYGGNKTHVTGVYGSGIHSAPKATGTGTGSGEVPVYGGSNGTVHTTHAHGTGVSTRPEATATSDSIPGYGGKNSTATETTAAAVTTAASIPGYGGKNSTATETTAADVTTSASISGYGSESSTAVETTAADITTSASVPGYGSETTTAADETSTPAIPGYGGEGASSAPESSAAATSTHAEKTTASVPGYGVKPTTTAKASTTAIPGYGASESSTFSTLTKPAETTTSAGRNGQGYGETTTSSSTHSSSSTVSSSTSTSTSTSSSSSSTVRSTSTKAEATTTAKITSAEATPTQAKATPTKAKTTKKIGY